MEPTPIYTATLARHMLNASDRAWAELRVMDSLQLERDRRFTDCRFGDDGWNGDWPPSPAGASRGGR